MGANVNLSYFPVSSGVHLDTGGLNPQPTLALNLLEDIWNGDADAARPFLDFLADGHGGANASDIIKVYADSSCWLDKTTNDGSRHLTCQGNDHCSIRISATNAVSSELQRTPKGRDPKNRVWCYVSVETANSENGFRHSTGYVFSCDILDYLSRERMAEWLQSIASTFVMKLSQKIYQRIVNAIARGEPVEVDPEMAEQEAAEAIDEAVEDEGAAAEAAGEVPAAVEAVDAEVDAIAAEEVGDASLLSGLMDLLGPLAICAVLMVFVTMVIDFILALIFKEFWLRYAIVNLSNEAGIDVHPRFLDNVQDDPRVFPEVLRPKSLNGSIGRRSRTPIWDPTRGEWIPNVAKVHLAHFTITNVPGVKGGQGTLIELEGVGGYADKATIRAKAEIHALGTNENCVDLQQDSREYDQVYASLHGSERIARPASDIQPEYALSGVQAMSDMAGSPNDQFDVVWIVTQTGEALPWVRQ